MQWDESNLQNSQKEFLVAKKNIESDRIISYAQALQEALHLSMKEDPNVIVLGQGVDDPMAMFGVSQGLKESFGGDRVFDTPVAEESITGICAGAAMNGLRPVYMHNRPDFLLLTFNQLVSHASKFHFMDNGETNVPMVVWSAIGRGWGAGAQHTQAIHGMLLGVPGLKILLPSTPYDAKGLMLSAIRDNNPVLIFEHRWLMRNKAHVPAEKYFIPIGKGVYRQRGKNLTIVGVSHTLSLAMKAMEQLSSTDLSADIIDLRSVKPIDEEIILESVKKTGRLLVVDTAWQMGGLCAEVSSIVADKGFSDLKAPIKKIGFPDIPTPAGHILENYYYPDIEKIKKVILQMLAN